MPNPKKNKSKEKKLARAARVAGGKPRPGSPAVQAAEMRIKAANSVQDLSLGLEPFLAIDLPAPKSSTGKGIYTSVQYTHCPCAGHVLVYEAIHTSRAILFFVFGIRE